VWIAPTSTFFRLVVPPLYLGVVGPYLVPGVGFPSRMPLVGTRPHPDLLGRNRQPLVHEAEAELKVQAEAKFHMYYFCLRWRLVKPPDLSGLSEGCAACARTPSSGVSITLRG
jgi:hypothetical protein